MHARWPVALFIVFSPIAPTSLAGRGEIRFVEVDSELGADGSAVVAYTIGWRVVSGELHGFCFERRGREAERREALTALDPLGLGRWRDAAGPGPE